MYLWKSLWVSLIAIGFVLVFKAQLSGAKFNGHFVRLMPVASPSDATTNGHSSKCNEFSFGLGGVLLEERSDSMDSRTSAWYSADGEFSTRGRSL